MHRRLALKSLLAGAGSLIASRLKADQAEISSTSPPKSTGKLRKKLRAFDDMMSDFLQKHRAPGAALAVTRNSRLMYARGFGLADVDNEIPVQPDSLFRIASISKPVTAVAVMQLAEKSRFGLDDRIFQKLPATEWLPEKHDQRLHDITIRHLLQHRAGWDREKSFDPIGRPEDVARVLGKSLPVNAADVTRYTLTLPLDFDPGVRYAYSNVGYLLLGRLIEIASGQSYVDYVRQNVLAPVGITRMQLGRAWKDDLAPGEVRYDSGSRQGPAVNGPHIGAKVPVAYGAENIEAFEAHGGWIASAIDLVRFASAFDHLETSRLLKAASIHEMWSRPEGPAGYESDGQPSASYYGCGWQIRPIGDPDRLNIWHTGMISGTSTILVKRHDGLNWAVLFNSDRDRSGKPLASLIDPLIHQAADAVRSWPDRELSL